MDGSRQVPKVALKIVILGCGGGRIFLSGEGFWLCLPLTEFRGL